MSPHEFLQAVMEASKKRFRVGLQYSNPVEFMSWLLNALHEDLIRPNSNQNGRLEKVEKNPTLVDFPVRNLELTDYIPLPS